MDELAAVRMYEAFCAGKAAGWSHANRAIESNPTATASEAVDRLTVKLAEDERDQFVKGFYIGLDDRIYLRPAKHTGSKLRF
jgi:hypothetical protein